MVRKIISTGFMLGFLGIILGAFGSHYLEGKVDTQTLHSFETGVRYQMYQSFLLLFLSRVIADLKVKRKLVYGLIVLGVCSFSGIIYLNAFSKVLDINLGGITILIPIGGFLMIFSWGYLAFLALRLRQGK